MESRYIKLEFKEALESKKQILYSELNLLNIAKKIRNYRLLRKKELAKKNLLYQKLKNTRISINTLQSTFPREKEPKVIQIRKKRVKEKEEENLHEQLNEIQEQLSRLANK